MSEDQDPKKNKNDTKSKDPKPRQPLSCSDDTQPPAELLSQLQQPNEQKINEQSTKTGSTDIKWRVVSPTDTTLAMNNDTVLASSSSSVTQLLLQTTTTTTTTRELCHQLTQLNIKIQLLMKSNYLRFIYFLIKNEFGVCYTSQLQKIFYDDRGNINRGLEYLLKNRIIEPANQENINKFLKYREFFTIDLWHFKRIHFYQLTEHAKIFYSQIPFNLLLSPEDIRQVEQWKDTLQRSHAEIDEEKPLRVVDKDQCYQEFKNYLHSGDSWKEKSKRLYWLGKKSKQFGVSPEELLDEFENRLWSDGNKSLCWKKELREKKG